MKYCVTIRKISTNRSAKDYLHKSDLPHQYEHWIRTPGHTGV